MVTVVTTSIGSGQDHADQPTWEAATDNDHVAADEVQVGEQHDDTNTSAELVIAGSTTDATRFRRLTVVSGSEYDPIADTGIHLNFDSGTPQHGINVAENNLQLSGFRISKSVGTNGDALFINASGGDDCSIFSMLLSISIIDRQALPVNAAGFQAQNCIINGGGSTNNGVAVAGSGLDAKLYNIVAYDFNRGIRWFGDTAAGTAIQNCASVECATNDWFFGGTTTSGTITNNLSSDTTAPGSSEQINSSGVDTFEDVTVNDFRPKDGGNAIDTGVDLSGTFTDDFDGVTRTTPWTIGAYIAALAAPLILRPHINVHLRR